MGTGDDHYLYVADQAGQLLPSIGVGQAMLKLCTSIGLTQAGLAALLGISRRAVGEWEAGSNYPKAQHLQRFLGLCVQQHLFEREQEEKEIRVL